MKERPILFSAPMVRAILEGRKTMTRRVVKPQPEMELDGECLPDGSQFGGWEPKLPGWSKWPYQLGDRLWVRENWRPILRGDKEIGYKNKIQFSADLHEIEVPPEHADWFDQRCEKGYHRRPSIHMPRWASRITLEITGIRVERLQDIIGGDAEAEGIDFLRHYPDADETLTAKQLFLCLWDAINGKTPGKSWTDNPWVWVVDFKMVTA